MVDTICKEALIDTSEIGRYKVKVTTYISPKTNKLYVLETTFDTTTGKVIDRKRFYHTKYGKKKW